jgi:hypothetical protein
MVFSITCCGPNFFIISNFSVRYQTCRLDIFLGNFLLTLCGLNFVFFIRVLKLLMLMHSDKVYDQLWFLVHGKLHKDLFQEILQES